MQYLTSLVASAYNTFNDSGEPMRPSQVNTRLSRTEQRRLCIAYASLDFSGSETFYLYSKQEALAAVELLS